MAIRQGSRRRNNRIIFLSAMVIILLFLLSLQPPPDGEVVTISVGDSSYQVANRLTEAGVGFRPLSAPGDGGLVVAYTPVTSFDRLLKKGEGSVYEILFGKQRVTAIVWRDSSGKALGRPLSVKVVGRR